MIEKAKPTLVARKAQAKQKNFKRKSLLTTNTKD